MRTGNSIFFLSLKSTVKRDETAATDRYLKTDIVVYRIVVLKASD